MRVAFVVAGLFAGCKGSQASETPAKGSMAPPEAKCLAKISIDHQTGSVLEELRSHGQQDDFPRSYAAATIDRANQVPVEAVKSHQINGSPILWFDAGKTAVVVDSAALSAVNLVDATRIQAGEIAAVGTVAPAALATIDARDLVTFLIRARVIATYAHIGSELCLAEEVKNDAGYRARYTGEHTYYTNEKNVDPLAFEVRIDPAGAIAIFGLPR
jgi:hypothetical protein